MLHVARYARGGSQGRVITASGGNFMSGQYSSTFDGAAHHNNAWLTPTNYPTAYKWLLSTDQAQLYRANGKDIAYNVDSSNASGASGPTGLGINNYTSEPSTWQMTEVILFNRQLTAGEMRLMESYMARMYGLTLDSDAVSSETDTAYVGNGNYYYSQYNQYYLSDIFTIEMWLKPTSTCDTTDCAIYSREDMLVTRIYAGTFWYALYGAAYGWQWTDTGVKVKSGEWHHIALSKRAAANTNGSLDVYLDGQLAYTKAGDPYYAATTATTFNAAYTVNQSNIWSYIGARAVAGSPRFYGAIDEVKIWNVARTGSQIAADMHSNDATSSNLQIYYDFNRNQLSSTANISNLAMGGAPRTDLIAATTITYEDVKVISTSGPYTTITFPRTYINQTGGWKVPSTVTTATTIVVGGGGGGGYGESTNRPAGGGGGGGVTASLTQTYVPASTVSIKVGQGGLGGYAADDPSVRNGQSSVVGVGGTLTALGGGGGGNRFGSGAGGSSVATGGGSGESTYTCAGSPAAPSGGTFVAGATVPSGNNGSGGIWGWGGSGGGARGAATNGDCVNNQAGIPGPGYVDPITSTEYGRGGNAAGYSTTYYISGYTTQNNGWGGIISYNGSTTPGANTSGIGYRGSSGTVVIRYITATKPAFTKPTNAHLNVGMTETFTTNVAQDSATVGLTRTFRWESTTAGAGGTFTPIKVGTGASNAAFSWVPTDTSTSGSQYLYRVVVTDSDTAGLFIQDTSTAVFATINPALRFSGSVSTISKQINVSRNDSFTVSLGTPTYRFSIIPSTPGITVDSSTATNAVLRISDTATVGTYSISLRATDSVSATTDIPLTIVISAPPSLTAGGEVVKNGQVLNLDAGNRASLTAVDGAATTSITWNDLSGGKKNGSTSNTVNSTVCNAPTYSTDFGGILDFTTAGSTCYNTPYLGSQFTTGSTIEAWFKMGTATIPNGYQVISQQYNTSNEQISLVIGDLDRYNGNIYVGFYDGNWRFPPVGFVPVQNQWNHVVGTYNGETLTTYLNGAPLGILAYKTPGGLVNTKPLLIGKRWDGASYFTGSIGEVRAYTRGLSAAEVLQNYNATKYRYEATNQTILKPSQKYGTITLESFTVTSGGDTETVSFAVGNRSGITWDTTTVTGQIRLTVQETLTPGTYYDTITVTDNFAQSTNLPIRFTVSKADTLTIYVDTPTALNYTGNRALFTPSVKGIGAVGFESGTALSATWRFKPAGTTCATGGYCRVGDLGPGGGIVFIDTSTASSDGRIYEVAPQNWSGSDDLSTVATYCSNNNSNIGATQVGIGWGETNTNLAKTACLGGAVAKVNSFNLSNSTGYSDWFIPSKNEATELAKIPATAGLLNIGNNWSVGNWGYWASTEFSSSVMWSIGHTGPVFNGSANVAKSEATKNMVRPVRAFKSCWAVDTCTALLTTETPTAAGIYMISPTSGVSAATLAERYSSIRYVDTRLTINRISQRAQVIPFLNVNFPDTFTVNVTEGNGNGAVTYTATNGTASGCAFDYKKIYSTTQGTCTVTVVKAGDRNYLPDTTTAGMYLLSFVTNQPSPSVGSGPTIALGGQTSVTLDPNVAPTITSLSTYTAQAGVTQIIITGVGFDSSNLAGITVKFWRNIIATGFTVNAQNTQITVTVPAGATTGKVTVTTPNGQAVSEFALTVTP
jgi:hypothetical protein